MKEASNTKASCITTSKQKNSRVNLVGQKFGRLTVTKFSHKTKAYHKYWNCICDCRKEIVVSGPHLVSGHTRSCGCWSKENPHTLKHGCSRSKKRASEYSIWRNMISRCHNQKSLSYKRYGGIGIAVCKEWRESFERFLSDMGFKNEPGLSIDRIDNNKGYEPNNCRWATKSQQARNRKTNKVFVINGETKTLIEWCEKFGISLPRVQGRLRLGWDIESALTKPKQS